MGRGGGGKTKQTKNGQKKKKKKSSSSSGDGSSSQQLLPQDEVGMIRVDPNRVRFQHSRIRPYFSGCGRSIYETLESIRKGEISPIDLPPIQVLVGPTDNKDCQPWYFSLNNRRLWVLKRCREEGMLEKYDNCIPVRVRQPKSTAEAARYSLENCALEAKVMNETAKATKGKSTPSKPQLQKHVSEGGEEEVLIPQEHTDNHQRVLAAAADDSDHKLLTANDCDDSDTDEEDDDDEHTDDDIRGFGSKNPFSALL